MRMSVSKQLLIGEWDIVFNEDLAVCLQHADECVLHMWHCVVGTAWGSAAHAAAPAAAAAALCAGPAAANAAADARGMRAFSIGT
jgi:hypothetical protein